MPKVRDDDSGQADESVVEEPRNAPKARQPDSGSSNGLEPERRSRNWWLWGGLLSLLLMLLGAGVAWLLISSAPPESEVSPATSVTAGPAVTLEPERGTTSPPVTIRSMPSPVPLPEFGIGSVGPRYEPAEIEGVIVDGSNYPRAINDAADGSILLIRGGTYEGGFEVPEGATVKPYNGEVVTVNGRIYMNEPGATIAGFAVDGSDEPWALRLDRDSPTPLTGLTIRNMVLRGGDVEALRISRNVHDVVITGNDLDGGKNNHVFKVHSEGTQWNPGEIRIVNNLFQKIEYATGEDLIQLQGHGENVVIENNTFRHSPVENAIDVKAVRDSEVLIRYNYFDGSTIEQQALLVQGSYSNTVVGHNHFDNGAGAMLGAHPEGKSDPWWRFEDNLIDGGQVILRHSFDAEIVGNTMNGGTLKLGLTDGDHPRDAVIVGNTFIGVDIVDRVTRAGDDYTCRDNILRNESGDWGRCL